MKELYTDRLRLRSWMPEDAPFLLDLESRVETMRYLGPGATVMMTIEQANASISRRRAVRGDGQGIWAIEHRENGTLVGNLLCKPMSEEMQRYLGMILDDPPSEIGWHLHPDAQRQGFATEAARAVLDYTIQANVHQRVFAIVDQRNEASKKTCARLGLERIGYTDGYAVDEHLVYVAPTVFGSPMGHDDAP